MTCQHTKKRDTQTETPKHRRTKLRKYTHNRWAQALRMPQVQPSHTAGHKMWMNISQTQEDTRGWIKPARHKRLDEHLGQQQLQLPTRMWWHLLNKNMNTFNPPLGNAYAPTIIHIKVPHYYSFKCHLSSPRGWLSTQYMYIHVLKNEFPFNLYEIDPLFHSCQVYTCNYYSIPYKINTVYLVRHATFNLLVPCCAL